MPPLDQDIARFQNETNGTFDAYELLHIDNPAATTTQSINDALCARMVSIYPESAPYFRPGLSQSELWAASASAHSAGALENPAEGLQDAGELRRLTWRAHGILAEQKEEYDLLRVYSKMDYLRQQLDGHDAYAVLGIEDPQSATAETISRAVYHSQMQPGRGIAIPEVSYSGTASLDPHAIKEEMSQYVAAQEAASRGYEERLDYAKARIDVAAKILSDPELRAAYDADLNPSLSGQDNSFVHGVRCVNGGDAADRDVDATTVYMTGGTRNKVVAHRSNIALPGVAVVDGGTVGSVKADSMAFVSGNVTVDLGNVTAPSTVLYDGGHASILAARYGNEVRVDGSSKLTITTQAIGSTPSGTLEVEAPEGSLSFGRDHSAAGDHNFTLGIVEGGTASVTLNGQSREIKPGTELQVGNLHIRAESVSR